MTVTSETRTCVICGDEFSPHKRHQMCCSQPCGARYGALRRQERIMEAGCSECIRRPGWCDDHQVPPVCLCDTPDDRPTCDRCNQRQVGMCHGCHRPYGPFFAEMREAWREHLGVA